MNISLLKVASVAMLPLLAQVRGCNPREIMQDVLDPDVVLHGEGTLEASGVGTITLRGEGSIEISASGEVGLVIFDAADVEYELDGEGQTYWYEGHLIVDGLFGTATIEGDDLRIGLHGGPMDLFAEGQGRVTLSGEGTYSTNGGRSTSWPGDDGDEQIDYAITADGPDVAPIPDADIDASRNYDELIQRVRDQLMDPDVVLGGTGTLDAQGTGSMMITGAGVIEITIEGHSGLVIFDADLADFELSGEGRTKWRGHDLIAEGLSGSAIIKGEQLRVVATGGPMWLHVEGTGQVRLSGSGTYEVNGAVGEDITERESVVPF